VRALQVLNTKHLVVGGSLIDPGHMLFSPQILETAEGDFVSSIIEACESMDVKAVQAARSR